MKNCCVIVMFFALCAVVTVAAQDGIEDQSLEISSETDLCSADVYINGGDPATDKKRTTIGQGETVTVTLTGKGVDENTSVTWVSTGNGATLRDNKKTSAILEASKTETGDMTVQAKVDGRKSNELVFKVIAPSGADGE